jgi:hypothetical protein
MSPTLSPSELARELEQWADERSSQSQMWLRDRTDMLRAAALALRKREAECERLRATLPMQALGAATARIHELVEVLLAIRSEAEEAPPGNADPWIVTIQRLVTDALPSPQEPK